jgi:hypothetical protein
MDVREGLGRNTKDTMGNEGYEGGLMVGAGIFYGYWC